MNDDKMREFKITDETTVCSTCAKGGKQSLVFTNLLEKVSGLCSEPAFRKTKEQFIFTSTKGNKELSEWRQAFEHAVKSA